jgi:hypothetical protein
VLQRQLVDLLLNGGIGGHLVIPGNVFTIALLWRFKPEDRCNLPIVDDEEEPGQESSPLMELDKRCSQSLGLASFVHERDGSASYEGCQWRKCLSTRRNINKR